MPTAFNVTDVSSAAIDVKPTIPIKYLKNDIEQAAQELEQVGIKVEPIEVRTDDQIMEEEFDINRGRRYDFGRSSSPSRNRRRGNKNNNSPRRQSVLTRHPPRSTPGRSKRSKDNSNGSRFTRSNTNTHSANNINNRNNNVNNHPPPVVHNVAGHFNGQQWPIQHSYHNNLNHMSTNHSTQSHREGGYLGEPMS